MAVPSQNPGGDTGEDRWKGQGWKEDWQSAAHQPANQLLRPVPGLRSILENALEVGVALTPVQPGEEEKDPQCRHRCEVPEEKIETHAG